MNGEMEIPTVPITTLAGVCSLTDLLPELPLPTPIPATVENKSLLFNPKIAEEARRLLSTRDENLVPQLISALSQTNVDHIELKDNLASDSIEGDLPELLKAILSKNPNVFKCGTVPRQPMAQVQQSPYHASSMSPYHAASPRYTQQPSHGSPYQTMGSPHGLGSPYQANTQYQQFASSQASTGYGLQQANGSLQASTTTGTSESASTAGPPASRRKSQEGNYKMKDMHHITKEPKIVLQHLSMDKQSFSSKGIKTSLEGMKLIEPRVKLTKLDMGTTSVRLSSSTSKKIADKKYIVTPDGKRKLAPSASYEDMFLRELQMIDSELGENVSLSERIKRRKRAPPAPTLSVSFTSSKGKKGAEPSRHEDIEEENEGPSFQEALKSAKKKKEKKQRRTFMPNMSTDELMETGTFKRFVTALENAIDSAEDFDVAAIEDGENGEVPSESLLSKGLLSDLCSETAKLKSMGVTNEVPYERLVKLLTILQWNVRNGAKILLDFQDGDSEEERLWRELTMDRVMSSVEAALSAMYIMTSDRMPKQVYLEDVIDTVLMMVKFQIHNTIYPEYDPVYRVDPANKSGYQHNIKMKRARSHGAKHKSVIALYNKIVELIGLLAELIDIQELTDTLVLQMSTLGVTPFFVENVSELQLNAMKIVTAIFSKYEKHRQLILEDIFASLARLPSSKRNIRSYRLHSDQSIQMVTALALQLIHSVIKLPQAPSKDKSVQDNEDDLDEADKEVVVTTSYERAMRTGHNFLSVFLKKCTVKGEEDYRPLFENFVQDLLVTVNKPEWPAAELLLSLLGKLLVLQFSNKSVDMSLRVASLDYLGIVASTLRRDAVKSQLNKQSIDEIIDHINSDSDGDSTSGRKSPEDNDQQQVLQKAILDYLAHNGYDDPALMFAREFYIAQWYRDSVTEVEKVIKTNPENTDSDVADQVEKTTRLMQNAEKRKLFLLTQASLSVGPLASKTIVSSKLDYESSCLVARYLSSNRPFSQSFDIYLSQILKVLSETAVAVRTKAMKCLTAVIEADPGILAREDMKAGVHGRFMDHSTSVREAAIELVGKFILIRPELIDEYYDMLTKRILDTGISVRKRVIKIFRDICIEQPDYPKIPEMCVKMIRRVNDEEGIKKLVNDVFQNMWFTPVRDKDAQKLLQKVVNITDVVAACKETGNEWLEQLLSNLLKKEEDSDASYTPVNKACRQMVDCLVENVLRLEEITSDSGSASSNRLVACLQTLYMFAKIQPSLLVHHAITIQPYLNIKCSTTKDHLVLHNVARILELVVPLMSNPSESFLMQLEVDAMKLVMREGMMVLQSCVSCLGAVVNKVSKNYKLVKDAFIGYFAVLLKNMDGLNVPKPTLLRALFTVGLFCKHFDFDAKEMGDVKIPIKNRAFDVFLHFIGRDDEDVRNKALSGLGFFCIRHFDYMLGKQVKDLYQAVLMDKDASVKVKCQVLNNLKLYLIEEEETMVHADAEWKKLSEKEDLKEMGDVQSGMASTIMQIYLKQVLEAFFHSQSSVRSTALSVIQLVLRQGLVHPVQCVPYLICIGTDCDANMRVKSDQQLQEIDKKYPGFVHMKSMAGFKMSFKLQKLIQQDLCEPIRGVNSDQNPSSLNNFLYSIVRTNRGHRRALLSSLLNMFDDTAKTPLDELVYVGDNLAFFPYQLQDEPMFIIHNIDIIVSVSGSNILQVFKESLVAEKSVEKIYDEDDDEDFEILLGMLPEDVEPLQEAMMSSQAVILLLVLKQHLKFLYGFKDVRIQQYSPTESAKVWDKPLSRKHGVKFYPKQALDLLKVGTPPATLDHTGRRSLLREYINFKQLMMSIDPENEDDSGRNTPNVIARPKVPAVADDDIPSLEIRVNKDGVAPPPALVTNPDTDSESDPPKTPHTEDDSDEEEFEYTVEHNTSHQTTSSAPMIKPLTIKLSRIGGGTEKERRKDRDESHHKSHKKHKKNKKSKKKKRRISSASDNTDDGEESDEDFMI